VAVDLADPSPGRWQEIVPEGEDILPFGLGADLSRLAGDRLIVASMRDAHYRITLHDLEGSPEGEIALPGLGSVLELWGRQGEEELFFSFTSFLQPASVFRYDLSTGALEPLHTPNVPVDLTRYETRQVFYASKDGTRVPMFLTHRTDLPRDGQNLTLLTGYGGFGVSLTPGFSASILPWLNASHEFMRHMARPAGALAQGHRGCQYAGVSRLG
jgi:prolyl oligopeptidase